MINMVYQLVSPRLIDVASTDLSLSGDKVIARPLYLAVCKADQRYYQGLRPKKVLKAKLPMALIHEASAQIIYDPTGTFEEGEIVAPVPNVATQKSDVIYENYDKSSYFLSSGHDGFLQDYIALPARNFVRAPKGMPGEYAALTEILSVGAHACARMQNIAHSRRDVIGIWGDGIVGYACALMARMLFPESKIVIYGTVAEKLNYFSFADELVFVDAAPEELVTVDHAFECVGGEKAQSAINQIIDVIQPQGSIGLMGVSENVAGINTRDVLEKGLTLFGSSRSRIADFQQVMDCFEANPEMMEHLERLIGAEVDVHSIQDIHEAFQLDQGLPFGKTVMKWSI